MEQLLKDINPELRTWEKERNPKISKEASDEPFLAACHPSKHFQLSPTHLHLLVSHLVRVILEPGTQANSISSLNVPKPVHRSKSLLA